MISRKNGLRIALTVVAIGATISMLAACTGESSTKTRAAQLKASQSQFDNRTPPKVTGDAEYDNYIKAQEQVYDNPATIIWCTASFPSDASPIFTVPIAGKLTSSTVSYYPSTTEHFDSEGGNYSTENQSVDGMYHGTPVAYRYGFTPGGQYVDFTGLAVFCTTALTSFQRASLEVANVDSQADAVTTQAEADLKAGNKAAAQKLLDSLGTANK